MTGSDTAPGQRSGFVAIVGRPNVGKSTLLNRLVGRKIAIVSPRPQTTRNRILGVRTLPGEAQIIFLDTPGLHEGKRPLDHFMMQAVRKALEEIDLALFLCEATENPRELDEAALRPLARVGAPVFLILNKVDLVRDKSELLPLMEAYRARFPFKELVPISASEGTNLDRLLGLIVGSLPPGPFYFPADAYTDQPETFWIAELIREQLFLWTHQEIPYACAVQVQEVTDRPEKGFLYVNAVIIVEQDSQKGIVIGAGGQRLKAIGRGAREVLEAFFGVRVYLELWVQVRKGWQQDPKVLKQLGYYLTS